MLDKTVISVPFTSGIDEKYPSQLLPQGMQSIVINGTYKKNGQIGKRPGMVALGNDLVGVQRLATRQQEVIALCDDGAGNTGAYSYSLHEVEWNQINANGKPPQLPPCLATRTGLLAGYDVISMDVCVQLEVVTYVAQITDVYSNGTPVNLIAVFSIDQLTGTQTNFQILNTFEFTPQLHYPKIFECGGNVVVVFVDPIDQVVWGSFNTTPGGTFSDPINILATNDVSIVSNFCFDAQPNIGGTSFIVAYQSDTTTAPTITMSVAEISNTLAPVLSTQYTLGTSTDIQGIGLISTVGENLWISYISNSGSSASEVVTLRADPSTLALTATVVSILAATLTPTHNSGRVVHQRMDSTHALVVASVDPASGLTASGVYWQNVKSDGTLEGSLGSQFFCHLATRPWQFSSHTYVGAFYFGGSGNGTGDPEDTNQPTMYILDLGVDPTQGIQAQCVSTIAPGISTDIQNYTVPSVTSVPVFETSTFLFPSCVSAGGNGRSSLQTIKIEYGRNDRWINIETANTCFIMSGTPTVYDGNTLTELGFLYYPESISVAEGSTGILDGVYQYLCVFEGYDKLGNFKQSAPCTPSSLSVSSKEIVIIYPCYCFAAPPAVGGGSLGENIQVAIYRTTANGTEFYRLTSINTTATTAANVYNVMYQTITDDLSDAVLVTHPLFGYVNGAELPNNCVPSENFATTHLNRVVMCGGDDPHNVWFSKIIQPGFQPGFNDGFTIAFDEEIVACASLEGQLVAWSNRSIYTVEGNGPDLTGAGDGFSTPLRIISDVGCVDPLSLCIVQDGIAFRSAGGIYMLTRSFEVVYWGHNVENELENGAVITSAILLDELAHQRFGITYSIGDIPSQTLCYDDVQKAWSVFQYGNPTTAIINNVAAVHWVGGYVFTDGTTVYLESADTFLDNGAWVTKTVTTAPIRTQNVQGFARFWNVILFGEAETPHDLTLSFAFNYETAPTQTHTWSWADISNFLDTTRETVSMKPCQQKVQAIQITISDATPTGGASVGTGEGMNLLSLDFELGIKKGYWKGGPAASRF